MSMIILGVLMIVVGAIGIGWFTRREPDRRQTFAAMAAFVAATLIMARPRNHDTAWFYIAALIATVAMTYLLSLWLRLYRRHDHLS